MDKVILTENGKRMRDKNGYRLRAAGIVTLPTDNPSNPKILLVSGIKNPANFVLPGGGIEKEEDAKEAALREVKEEAGVICEIMWGVGEFKDDIKLQRTFLYILKPIKILEEWDDRRRGRTRSWIPLNEALEKIKPRQRIMIKAYVDHVTHSPSI
uniref:Aps (inferred by orthology to a D. melanogaster protein) n=1 Tax=Strongyloides venezuelensis TaxID=75913 RepID=A0A0K0FY50_STRVS